MSPEKRIIGKLGVGEVLSLIENTNPCSRQDFLRNLASKQYPQRIIDAFSRIPRDKFMRRIPFLYTYAAKPWPVGIEGVTISDPNLVALMVNELNPQEGDRVLDVGLGSGYQAAILGTLIGESGTVLSFDINEQAVNFARGNLQEVSVTNVQTVLGDGIKYALENKPFDRIIISSSIPPFLFKDTRLLDSLSPNGRLVAPLGGINGISPNICRLLTAVKKEDGSFACHLGDRALSFVYLGGEHGWDPYIVDHLSIRPDIAPSIYPIVNRLINSPLEQCQ